MPTQAQFEVLKANGWIDPTQSWTPQDAPRFTTKYGDCNPVGRASNPMLFIFTGPPPPVRRRRHIQPRAPQPPPQPRFSGSGSSVGNSGHGGYGPTFGPAFGPTFAPTFAPTFGPTFGPGYGQGFGQGSVQGFGQGVGQGFGQGFGQGYNGSYGGQQQYGTVNMQQGMSSMQPSPMPLYSPYAQQQTTFSPEQYRMPAPPAPSHGFTFTTGGPQVVVSPIVNPSDTQYLTAGAQAGRNISGRGGSSRGGGNQLRGSRVGKPYPGRTRRDGLQGYAPLNNIKQEQHLVSMLQGVDASITPTPPVSAPAVATSSRSAHAYDPAPADDSVYQTLGVEDQVVVIKQEQDEPDAYNELDYKPFGQRYDLPE